MTQVTAPSSTQRQRKASQTRETILEVARRLFVSQGINGVSYGDIAKEVGTTRANLHYHFGNKSDLLKEVFDRTFEDVARKLDDIWLSPGLTLEERLDRTLEDSRTRFHEFNDGDGHRVPWSLSSRVRFDFSVVDNDVVDGIAVMSRKFQDSVTHAVQLAIGSGELAPDTPVKDVVLMITPLWFFGSPITQFAGLRRLENHFEATKRIIKAAYGAGD